MIRKKSFVFADGQSHSLSDIRSFLEHVPMKGTEVHWNLKNDTLIGSMSNSFTEQVAKLVDEIRIRKLGPTQVEVEIRMRFSIGSIALLISPGIFIWFLVGVLGRSPNGLFSNFFPNQKHPTFIGFLLPFTWLLFLFLGSWLAERWAIGKIDSYLKRVLGLI